MTWKYTQLNLVQYFAHGSLFSINAKIPFVYLFVCSFIHSAVTVVVVCSLPFFGHNKQNTHTHTRKTEKKNMACAWAGIGRILCFNLKVICKSNISIGFVTVKMRFRSLCSRVFANEFLAIRDLSFCVCVCVTIARFGSPINCNKLKLIARYFCL